MEKRLTADMNVVANSNLEIQLLDGDLNIIQKLDDEPNDVGGLTSAELKAKFDESGNIIKKYINETLIPAVRTSIPTALPNPEALTIQIGSTSITYDGSTAQTVTIADGTEVAY